jgi:hypothetical protein
MSRYTDEDWDEDSNHYLEEDDVEPWDRDSDDETTPCPYCGASVYEGADQCPHCNKYLSKEDAPSAAKPWWIIAGVIVVLGLIYMWTFGMR